MTNIETFRICLGILAKGMAGVLIVAAVIFVLLCIRRRVKAKKAAKKAAAEAANQPLYAR